MTAQGYTGPTVAIGDVSGLQGELDDLATDILANAALIAANTSAIATNTAGIATNATNITRTRGAFIGATDHGYQAWTADAIMGQAATVVPTAGLSHIVRLRTGESASLATNLHMHLTVGGSVLTSGQCFASLHTDAGVILGAGAVTGSLHATGTGGWGDSGYKTLPLTTPQVITPNTWYKIRFWFNGTTGPTVTRDINSASAITNAGLSSPNFRYATADSGLTTAALAPGTIGTLIGTATAWWMAIS